MIAVVIGTAFFAITLAVGETMSATARQTIHQTVGDANVVVSSGFDKEMPKSALEEIKKVPGVTSVRGDLSTQGAVFKGNEENYMDIATVPPTLSKDNVAQGVMPAKAGEVAIAESTANVFGYAVGDTLKVKADASGMSMPVPAEGEAGGENGLTDNSSKPVAPTPSEQKADVKTVKVTAILRVDQANAAVTGIPTLFTNSETVLSIDPETYMSELFVKTTMGDEKARATIAALPVFKEVSVRTGKAEIAHRIKEMGESDRVLKLIISGFAAIALVVVTMVIANTFAIVVAQQRRLIGLLGCIGATPRQMFGIVVRDSVTVGFIGSAIGLVSGLGLCYGGIAVAKSFKVSVVPFGLTPTLMLLPLAVGVFITAAAALIPALSATRITPMAALRPADVDANASAKTRARSLIGLILFTVGAGLLVVGAVKPSPVLAGVGGVMTFTGAVMLFPVVVPVMAMWLGNVFGAKKSPLTELASMNARRNPTRAAVTTGALAVGVTLIVTTMTALSIGVSSLANKLDESFPIDATVTASESLTAKTFTELKESSLVAKVAPVDQATVQLKSADGRVKDQSSSVAAITDEVRQIPRDKKFLAPVTDSTIVVPEYLGFTQDEKVVLTIGDKNVTVTAVVLAEVQEAMISKSTFDKLSPSEVTKTAWIQLASNEKAVEGMQTIAKNISQDGVMVDGGASARSALQGMANIVMYILLALLGVSVLIALVGVSNTLHLAVSERRQETGLLSALGLTPAGVKAVVNREAAMLAIIGSVLGVLLGVGFGIAASAAIMGKGTTMVLDLPWLQLVTVLVCAAFAGWLASVGPARAAANTLAVEALSAD